MGAPLALVALVIVILGLLGAIDLTLHLLAWSVLFLALAVVVGGGWPAWVSRHLR